MPSASSEASKVDCLRDQVQRLVAEAGHPVRSVVVNAEAVYDVDTTGLAVLARVRTSVRDLMRRTGLEDRIGGQNFHLTVARPSARRRGSGSPFGAYRLGDPVARIVGGGVGVAGGRAGGGAAAAGADQDLQDGQEQDHEQQGPDQPGE